MTNRPSNTRDMTDILRNLTDILHQGRHSLVVANGTEIRTFDGRGVSDLFRLIEDDPQFMDGAVIADKIIGKGAAAIMILGKVRSIHTDVISTPALVLFRKYGINVRFVQEVPHIINRAGTGFCPVETLCRDCLTAEQCLPLIRKFITETKL